MNSQKLAPIYQHVVSKLGQELRADLGYHSLNHTLDVLKQANMIARAEGIANQDELFLLQVAALYHDMGFLRAYLGHEEESCRFALEELPAFGLSGGQIEQVCDLIRATCTPQRPLSRLAEILCDADLDYLGRDDFEPTAHLLYLEFLKEGIVTGEDDWNRKQLAFLENHHYFTAYSKACRAPQKAAHLHRLKGQLSKE